MGLLMRDWTASINIESLAAHRLLAVIERLPSVRTSDLRRDHVAA